MKLTFLPAAMMLLAGGVASAATVICDFEDYPVGYAFPVWNFYGSETTTTAVVETDPAGGSNKVLHITLRGWNDYVEFTLPDHLAGTLINDGADRLTLDTRRAVGDPCGEWKHFDILVGADKIYEDDGWPAQGPEGEWQGRTYRLGEVPEGNTSTALRLGYNSENTDYFIDNVVLSKDGEEYVEYPDGRLDFSDPASTSSAYTTFSTPIRIPAGTTLDVYTSRYTYWMSPVVGEGNLNIHGGGERSYIGNEKGAKVPDWSGYTGDITIMPFAEVNPSVTAGFYGVVLGHGGYKYDADRIVGSIAERLYTPTWENNTVTIADGATVAAEANNTARAHRIGRLVMQPGSRLMGYYKSAAYRVYYIVGGDNADSRLEGEISPSGSSPVGLVKEGTGTYTITGNNNNISGALSIVGGTVLVANDADAARASKLRGAIGTGANSTGVYVYRGATLGGDGSVSGVADIYGHLNPGAPGTPGTLTFADFASGNGVDIRLRPSSRLIFDVASASSADRLDLSGKVMYYNIGQDLEPSDVKPVLEIALPEGHTLKAGDEFTLISATGKGALDGGDWTFRIQYPKAYTWEVSETVADGNYTLKARVTSTAYSGQGDTIIEDGGIGSGSDDDWTVDYTADLTDPTPLRTYAAQAGKSIGVAVPVWRYDISDPSDANTALIASQFNAVVAENEMKFDATEPERGVFSLDNGDRLVNFAASNGMAVRGHTLVWHSQVPSWLSSDGKKNDKGWTREQLTEIMYNHIDNVAGHFAGRVREWDVVNECLDDDQSIVRSNPDGYKLRAASVWTIAIGEDFIAQAFRRAHEADPEARLFLNDYGVEFKGDLKAEAFYNLAKRLVEAGVPIHGVGLQCHLTVGKIDVGRLVANIRRFNELGLECIITELDIAQADPSAADAQQRQAEAYGAVVNGALSQPNCPTVMIWGLLDTDSWRENNPLLYDGQRNAKSAYYAVHAALRLAADGSDLPGIFAEEDAAGVVATEYYNLAGMRVACPSGLVIRVSIHADGTRRAEKVVMVR